MLTSFIIGAFYRSIYRNQSSAKQRPRKVMTSASPSSNGRTGTTKKKRKNKRNRKKGTYTWLNWNGIYP